MNLLPTFKAKKVNFERVKHSIKKTKFRLSFNLLSSYRLVSFQGSYGIVKLAYNESDDSHYVSMELLVSTFYMLCTQHPSLNWIH